MTSQEYVQQQLTALDNVRSELQHFYNNCASPTESADIFADQSDVDELYFAKKAKYDLIVAGQGLKDAALVPTDISALESVLATLNKYVRNDQAVQMSISFLLQVVDKIGTLKA